MSSPGRCTLLSLSIYGYCFRFCYTSGVDTQFLRPVASINITGNLLAAPLRCRHVDWALAVTDTDIAGLSTCDHDEGWPGGLGCAEQGWARLVGWLTGRGWLGKTALAWTEGDGWLAGKVMASVRPGGLGWAGRGWAEQGWARLAG